ncbi:MAG: type II toxin-antitoxin system MqsA family antitoxin [Rhodanobacteraceae bacterium]
MPSAGCSSALDRDVVLAVVRDGQTIPAYPGDAPYPSYMAEGIATVTVERGATTAVIKDVPAQACAQCGEYYLSAAMTDEELAMAGAAVRKGVEVEILRWAA